MWESIQLFGWVIQKVVCTLSKSCFMVRKSVILPTTFLTIICITAWESYEEHLKNIYLQSKAIMFYSVPHRGSALANFTLPFLSRSVELLEVQKGNLKSWQVYFL